MTPGRRLSALALLLGLAVAGVVIFGITVPDGSAPAPLTGIISDIYASPDIRSSEGAYLAAIKLPDGRLFVATIPNGAACVVGQQVRFYRRNVWFGTRTLLGPEGCRLPAQQQR